MAPPQLPHGCTAAFRTYGQVNAPYGLEQFCYGHPGKALLETLTILEFKDDLEIFVFHPVIQESIITYFLKTGRQHMHKVTADKFRMFQCNLPFWPAWFSGTGRECNRIFCNRKDPAVRDGDLVRVSSQVFDGIAKTIKGFLDVGAPVLFIKGVFPFSPVVWITQHLAGRRKGKGTGFVK